MPVVLYALPVEHFIIWWELELHTIFNENTNELFKGDKQSRLIFYGEDYKPLNYSLLNVKFK